MMNSPNRSTAQPQPPKSPWTFGDVTGFFGFVQHLVPWGSQEAGAGGLCATARWLMVIMGTVLVKRQWLALLPHPQQLPWGCFCAPGMLGVPVFSVLQLDVTQRGWDILVTGPQPFPAGTVALCVTQSSLSIPAFWGMRLPPDSCWLHATSMGRWAARLPVRWEPSPMQAPTPGTSLLLPGAVPRQLDFYFYCFLWHVGA